MHPTIAAQWVRLKGWASEAESWQLALGAALLLILSVPAMPALLVVGLGVGLYLFSIAWAREFRHLIRLDDSAFPGRNDKLIWAILLIVLPPAGVLMFRPFRQARWPEAKPAAGPTDRDFS
jgi:hypothetical protein